MDAHGGRGGVDQKHRAWGAETSRSSVQAELHLLWASERLALGKRAPLSFCPLRCGALRPGHQSGISPRAEATPLLLPPPPTSADARNRRRWPWAPSLLPSLPSTLASRVTAQLLLRQTEKQGLAVGNVAGLLPLQVPWQPCKQPIIHTHTLRYKRISKSSEPPAAMTGPTEGRPWEASWGGVEREIPPHFTVSFLPFCTAHR